MATAAGSDSSTPTAKMPSSSPAMSNDSYMLIVGITLIVAIISTIYLVLRRMRQTRRDHVLLLGASDCGKTTLFNLVSRHCRKNAPFTKRPKSNSPAPSIIVGCLKLWHSKKKRSTFKTEIRAGLGRVFLWSSLLTFSSLQLANSRFFQSVTSIKENIGPIEGARRRLWLVDIPGHDRLRPQMTDKYRDAALGVVFVIDAEALGGVKASGDAPASRDVASVFYETLVDQALAARPLLAVCNRTDDAANCIEQLEAEFETIRRSHFNPTRNVYESYLGTPNEPFRFEQLKQSVRFVCVPRYDEASELDRDRDAAPILKWLETI